MTESDQRGPVEDNRSGDGRREDSGEAGNFVSPVELDEGAGTEIVEGTDPAVDKGSFTSSTDLGNGRTVTPNVTREDGDYTSVDDEPDSETVDGGYIDNDETRPRRI